MDDYTARLPLESLIEDKSIYPRHGVDDSRVRTLVKTLEAGSILPPPVVDNASKRIADGWHRKKAYLRVLGNDGVIDVILRTYASEEDLLLDAISMNATHGKPLDVMDCSRITVMCRSRGIDDARIAEVLRQPEKEIQKYSLHIVHAPEGSPGTVPGTSDIVLKRPAYHMAGATVTREQADALVSLPGTSLVLVVNQLRKALRGELANRQGKALQQALRDLRDDLIIYCQMEASA